MKRKPKSRTPGNTAISVSLPEDLVAEIDAAARADARTRSQWLRVKINHILEEEQASYGSPLPAKSPARKPRLEKEPGAA